MNLESWLSWYTPVILPHERWSSKEIEYCVCLEAIVNVFIPHVTV